MSKILDSIIDLNYAISIDDLNTVKIKVEYINNNIEDLKDTYHFENDDIGVYFNIYDIVLEFTNESGAYVLNNLKGLYDNHKEKALWNLNSKRLLKEKDIEGMKKFLETTFSQYNSFQEYQLSIIYQMITITKEYNYLVKLKGKGAK